MEPRKHKVDIPGGATLENLIMFSGTQRSSGWWRQSDKEAAFSLALTWSRPGNGKHAYAVKHRTAARTKTLTMVIQRGACLKHDLCRYTVALVHFFNKKSAPLVAAQEPMA